MRKAIILWILLVAASVRADADNRADMIPARFGPFVAFKAGVAPVGPIIRASYDLIATGAVRVDPRVAAHLGQPDADLLCFGEGGMNKYDYYCNEKAPRAGMKPSKKFTVDGRVLCVEPDQPLPPGRTADDASGWSANVTWSGWGDCSLVLARGTLGKKISPAALAAAAAEAAKWMEPFIRGIRPSDDRVAENRRLLQPILTARHRD